MDEENRLRSACRAKGRKMPEEAMETLDGPRNTEVNVPLVELFDTLHCDHIDWPEVPARLLTQVAEYVELKWKRVVWLLTTCRGP